MIAETMDREFPRISHLPLQPAQRANAMLQSAAKLRTRTGCLRCRKRRKKCDEARPRCAACTRNELDCEWPSGKDPVDGRRGKRRQHAECEASPQPLCSLSIVRQPSSPIMPSPFHTEEHYCLFQHFTSTILPRLVRQSSIDQTYMICLAPEYPPLMGAMISVAGMQIASRPSWSVNCAVKSYLYTIISLQKALMQLEKAGDDDRILATVILLSVFEASRLDMAPNVAPHTTASGYLLTQRQSHLGTRSMAPAVFDRICIESFIYHASIMMLFEPSLDALSSIRQELDIPRYFSYVEKSEISLPVQPILQTSYDFFLSIADATKLARISRSLVDAEITLWCNTWLRLIQWDQVDHTDDASLKLYFTALQILLLKTAPDLLNEEKTLQISECLQDGLQIIVSLEPEQYASSYLLWPLAILGSISISERERNAARDYINMLIQSKRGGQAVWVQKRLDRVWNLTKFPANCPSSGMRLRGLQLLLDAT